MKRNILSLLFVMLIAFVLVGCEKKTTKTTAKPTQSVTNSRITTISTKPGTEVSSIPSDAVFEYFEWSNDYSSCNAVFKVSDNTLKLNVEVDAEITDSPSCTKEGTLVVTVVYGEHTETKTVKLNKLDHQPAEAVRENIVTKENGDVEYDLVVYCLVCNEELSRTHKVEKAGSENIDTPWIEG